MSPTNPGSLDSQRFSPFSPTAGGSAAPAPRPPARRAPG